MCEHTLAATREPPTLADYVITAISPALIMGLVGSLVFFLAELCYGSSLAASDQYEGRLLWTLFFFVFGIVLVARISIVVDPTRSTIYGLALLAVCWIAMQAFVDIPASSPGAAARPIINAGLLLVVWWCSNRLTWDCTHIDERREADSRGLLAVAGMEKRHVEMNRGAHVVAPEVAETPDENLTLGQRWRKYRERRLTRPHTPGVTVLYFSIAALPMFGLGQALIPAADEPRRRFTFWLTAVYVGCALGLLLTTSFLGLRRYLRQRRLKMPMSMTSVWMGMGAALIVAFLVVASLLPRPYSETSPFRSSSNQVSNRKASNHAVLKDGAGKGEGAAGDQTTKGEGDGNAKGGDPGGKGRKGDAKKGSGSKDGKNSGDGGDQDKADSGKKVENDPGDNSKDNDGSAKDATDQKKDGSSDSYKRFQNSSLGRIVESVAQFLKWAVFIVILVIVLALVFRGGLQYLAGFMPWARRLLDSINAWWQNLFGKRSTPEAVVEGEKESGPTHVPFSTFRSPFDDGSASSRSLPELIEYSFAALEAWAADRDKARREDETAGEFAGRLESAFPSLEPEPRRLANLVARLMYARGTVPASAIKVLQAFWDRIDETHVEDEREFEVLAD